MSMYRTNTTIATFVLTIIFFDIVQQTGMAIKNTKVVNIYVPNAHTLANVQKAEIM